MSQFRAKKIPLLEILFPRSKINGKINSLYQKVKPDMKAWRISSPSLTVMIAVLFITQLQMQSIPRVAIYHAGDGTECSCGCTEQESTHEENVCCVPGVSMLVCLCDDDHYKRAELAPLQLIDMFFTVHNSLTFLTSN